jgi:hypothetical protein
MRGGEEEDGPDNWAPSDSGMVRGSRWSVMLGAWSREIRMGRGLKLKWAAQSQGVGPGKVFEPSTH